MKTFTKLVLQGLVIILFCVSPMLSHARTNYYSHEYNARNALSISVTCPANITLNCNDPIPPDDPNSVTASSPGCGIISITWIGDVSITGICPNESIISRTYRVVDGCSSSMDCTQTITIVDNTPPIINCSNQASPINCPSTPVFIPPTAIDACDPNVTITFMDAVTQGVCVNSYIVTRTWTATDDCGNTSSCIGIIVVQDNLAPQITCPPNITLNCNQSTSPGNLGIATAIDNCDPIVTITFSDANIPGLCVNGNVINRTFVATDDCGNSSTCLQTITLIDNIDPVITCPPDLTISCSANTTPANTGLATAIDNCDPVVTITYTEAIIPGLCVNQYIINRTFIATDDCGNTSTCIQTISVVDNTGPAITCPANLTVSCSSQVPLPDPASVSTTDNCGGTTTITHAGDVITNQVCADKYTLSRTYIATDACGNSSTCVQTITVFDNIAPILTCPANITTNCNMPTFSATATDNCGGPVTVSYSPPSGSVLPQGVTLIVATGTDACGNSATCSFSDTNYLGSLTNYHMIFTNGSLDANWQGPTNGYIGDVAVDGIQAIEKTNGTIPYAGTIYSNATTLSKWQNIVNANPGQAASAVNEIVRLADLENELETAFTLINALPVTSGYDGVSATSLNNLNSQNSIAEKFVINVTTGFTISTKINITGDANDIFILRWDSDKIFSNGYDGLVKFQNGGAIVPLGGLNASNFIHVAGDIKGGGNGSNPAAPYPQGPRTNNGTGSLINGGTDFSGGGFFTGYWLTTGAPTITGSGQPYGKTSSLVNAIFVGGWYSKTTKISMGSGTSGVYVSPCLNQYNPLLIAPTNEVPVAFFPSNDLMIKVWPNPSDQKFTLDIQGDIDVPNFISVYDIKGTRLLQFERPGGQLVQFGEDFSDGIYFVQIRQGHKYTTMKLIKQDSK